MKKFKIILALSMLSLSVGCSPLEKFDTSEQEIETIKETDHKVIGKDFLEVSDDRPDKVRNDTTGNWRIITIAEPINIQEYAVDYYNRYFEDSKQIHAIVNFSYNTTTKISDMGTFLDVTIMEYVEKEEHDAKLLFGGQRLKQYFVNKEDSSIEEIK